MWSCCTCSMVFTIHQLPPPSFVLFHFGQAHVSLPSRETILHYQLNECLIVVLKSEIGHGATGVVLRGTLEVEASEGCVLLYVAVKLALASHQCDALMNKYEIIHRLR